MKPFRRETGVMVPLLSDGAGGTPTVRSNVDTDQIIPKQFLKRIERTGFGPSLFFDWRYRAVDGVEEPTFVLNQEPYRRGSVLIAGRNFGCGSSREHAVWALLDQGFRAVIAPSFADIFRGNSAKAGLLPVVLPDEAIAALVAEAVTEPGAEVTVDLEAREVRQGSHAWSFAIDPFTRHCMLEGLDDIALTLRHADAITAFEARRPTWLPNLRQGSVSP